MISVLIVEDDFRVADLHREFVERCDGFEVAGVALTARQAIDLNRELAPDLILLDLYLPDEHGLDVVETLRADSGADVIVITAARDVPNIRAAMQHGALFYIVKPFRFAAFRERMDAFARLRPRWATRLSCRRRISTTPSAHSARRRWTCRKDSAHKPSTP